MKKHIIILLIVICNIGQAQVGINTNDPKATLDINGGFNVRKELRIKGTDLLKGAAGVNNQMFMVDESSTINDKWQTVNIANGTGSLSLYYLNTKIDNTGIEFVRTGSTSSYVENAPFVSSSDSGALNWQKLNGNSDSFTITDVTGKSKAVLSFQTTIQIKPASGSTGTSASYACGIFMSKNGGAEQLKGVRSDVLVGVSGSYKIFNLNVTLDNLGVGNYVVTAACSNRQLGSGTSLVNLGIGKPINETYLNKDMTQSVLTTSVLQPY